MAVLLSFFLAFQGTPADPPIVVRIVEPNAKTLSDVVLGAIGLSGLLTAIAIVLAIIFAGILFLIRSRNPLSNASQGVEDSR